MEDTNIIALFWARNEDAIAETDAAYGRKLRALAISSPWKFSGNWTAQRRKRISGDRKR